MWLMSWKKRQQKQNISIAVFRIVFDRTDVFSWFFHLDFVENFITRYNIIIIIIYY